MAITLKQVSELHAMLNRNHNSSGYTVRTIRTEAAAGVPVEALAKRFDMSETTIRHIVASKPQEDWK